MHTTLEFRNFEVSHYPEIIELHNQVYPNEPTELELLQDFDSKRMVSRVVVKNQNTIIAYYQFRINDNSTEKGLVIDIICEDKTSLESLSSIYSHLQKTITPENPKHLITKVYEPNKVLHNYYLSMGFIEQERMWPSSLDLKTFNRSSLEGSVEKAQSQGINFKTLADFENNTETQTMYYNCLAQCLKDVPTAEPINIWPFELWKERFWNSKNRITNGNFMALDGKTLVGISQLWPSAKEGDIKTGLTGVLGSYRGKGIAKALKLLATDYAIDNDYKTISTHNHSINKPMLAINEAMGYSKSPAIIFLKRAL